MWFDDDSIHYTREEKEKNLHTVGDYQYIAIKGESYWPRIEDFNLPLKKHIEALFFHTRMANKTAPFMIWCRDNGVEGIDIEYLLFAYFQSHVASDTIGWCPFNIVSRVCYRDSYCFTPDIITGIGEDCRLFVNEDGIFKLAHLLKRGRLKKPILCITSNLLQFRSINGDDLIYPIIFGSIISGASRKILRWNTNLVFEDEYYSYHLFGDQSRLFYNRGKHLELIGNFIRDRWKYMYFIRPLSRHKKKYIWVMTELTHKPGLGVDYFVRMDIVEKIDEKNHKKDR